MNKASIYIRTGSVTQLNFCCFFFECRRDSQTTATGVPRCQGN